MGCLQKLMFCDHGIFPDKETEGTKENAITIAQWGAAVSEGY
jgi:hypothetical protein